MITRLRTLFLLYLLAGSAAATQIATTYPLASEGSATPVGNLEFAAGFSVPSTGNWTFDSAVLGLAPGEGTPGALTVSLYDDNSTTPGSQLITLSPSTTISSTGPYTFSGNQSLTAGAVYWLVASLNGGNDNNTINWLQGTNQSAGYVDSQFYAFGWSGTQNEPLAFSVNATDNSQSGSGGTGGGTGTIPEPTTLALLGLGLAGIGAARRRKTA